MTIKRTLLAFFAFIVVMLAVAGAHAQGDKAVEGKNFWVVNGSNKDWTYLKIGKDVNLDAAHLAALMKTDMFSIRTDNPTKTLAVCRIGNRWSMANGIKSPAARATNAIWKDCSAENQRVVIIPGERLVLKGLKYLSFSQQQDQLKVLGACTSADCVADAVKPLAPKVSWSKDDSQSSVAVPAASSPAGSTPTGTDGAVTGAGTPPAAPPQGASEAKEAAAPPPPPVVSSQTNWVLWALAGLLFIAVALLIVQTVRLRRAKKKLELQDPSMLQLAEQVKASLEAKIEAKQAEIERLRAALESWQQSFVELKRQMRAAINRICLACLDGSFDIGEHEDPVAAIDQIVEIAKRRRDALREGLSELRRTVESGVVVSPENILTPAFVRDTKAAVQAFRSELEATRDNLLAAQQGAEGAQQSAEDARQRAEQERDELRRNLQDILRCLSGADDEDMTGEAVTDDDRPTWHATPLDAAALMETRNALKVMRKNLQRVLADHGAPDLSELPDSFPALLAAAIDLLGKRSESMARYRADLGRQEAKIAQLQTELDSLRSYESEESGVHSSSLSPRTGYTLPPPLPPHVSVHSNAGASPEWVSHIQKAADALRHSITIQIQSLPHLLALSDLWKFFHQGRHVQIECKDGRVATYTLLSVLEGGEKFSEVQTALAATG